MEEIRLCEKTQSFYYCSYNYLLVEAGLPTEPILLTSTLLIGALPGDTGKPACVLNNNQINDVPALQEIEYSRHISFVVCIDLTNKFDLFSDNFLNKLDVLVL